MTDERDATPWIDVAAYEKMVEVVTPFVSTIHSACNVTIEKLDGQPGWTMIAGMTTDEGYVQRQAVLTPTNADDFTQPWQLVVRWSSRDCDGMMDGATEYMIEPNGYDENNSVRVSLRAVDSIRHDRQAEAAGY